MIPIPGMSLTGVLFCPVVVPHQIPQKQIHLSYCTLLITRLNDDDIQAKSPNYIEDSELT